MAQTKHSGGETRTEHQETNRDRMSTIGEGARDAVGNARGMAEELVAQLPAAASATKSMADEAARQMESTSDLVLTLGSSFAFGIALGLFISGSNRVAVAMALIPAVGMTMTMVDRRSRGSLDSLTSS